jgi:hypothetical protein
MMGAFLDWLLYRNRSTMTGIYHSGYIYPHQIHPPVLVGARIAQRLQSTDRVQFVAVEQSTGPSIAHRVRVYRRPRPT